jgi:hypothetical protein
MVSQESLARTIRDLEAFRTRYSYRIKCESAAFYLRDRLASLGYAVRLDTYYLQSPTTRSFNVEAGLVGQVRPESIVIACAHYDSYSTNFDSAPGADDNGTGTAAVLELARVLREKQYRWSLKLLCFSGEEQWMKGSYHWVDSTAVPQGLAIAGVYNLDMFGYTAFDTNLLFVTRDAPSAPLAALAESANVWYSLGLDIMNYLDPDCYGDNTPFWERGYRAVFACEDSEWGIWNGSNPHYHTPHDTFVNLNMPQVTRSTRMAAACLATLAAPYDPGAASEDRPLTGPRSQLPGTSILVPGLTFPGSGPSELWSADGRLSRVLHGEHRTAALPAGIYFLRRPGSPPVSRVVLVR